MIRPEKGFTFLELIITVIILGIIVATGAVQYTNTIAKARAAEAKANLGTMRSMALVYYQENNAYPDDTYISNTLGLPAGTGNGCGNSGYFFKYHIDSGTGSVTAYRCTSGGKTPDSSTAYSLTLTIDGAGSSSPVGWW